MNELNNLNGMVVIVAGGSTPYCLSVCVARKLVEAEDIFTFELVSADGDCLPAFSASSHLDVHIQCGLTRQYSLCKDPAESDRHPIGVLNDTVFSMIRIRAAAQSPFMSR